jgi:hypothetical protein
LAPIKKHTAMKLNTKLILIPFILSTFILHGQDDVEFKAGVPPKVQVGDEFFLSFKVNRKAKDIKIEGSFTDFRVNYGPSVSTSNSTSISNGVMTKTEQTSFSYSLVAQKCGVFTLPYASIIIDSVKYCTESISIIVAEKDTTSLKAKDTGKIFTKLILSADTVFKQEPIIAQLKLYSNMTINSIENLQIPQNENFLFYELSIPEKFEMKTDTINNEILKSVLLKKFLLIPSKTGEFNIDRIKIDCRVRKAEPKKSSAFDDFFKSYQTETISINTDSTSIFVQDFQGEIPKDFTYISGNNLKISVSLDKPIIKKNELFKYSITISGVGNLKLLSIPKVQFPQDLKVLKSEYKNNLETDSLGINGERVFSYYLCSDSLGKYEIPSFSISYFDLGNNKIHQISSPTVLLEVEKTDLTKSNQLLNSEMSVEKYNKKDSKFASLILLDLSASMLAQDLQPNRKTAVIKAINNYVLETKQSTGIIVYSSIPELLSPITTNKTTITESLKTIDSLKLGDGTSTGMAICMALDKLQKKNAKIKSIILLTDGESNTGAINEKMAIEFAKHLNIPVNIIGIGAKAEFVPITINTEFGEHKTTVPVQINDEKLKELSDQTGGKYYRVVDNETLKEAINEIDKNKKKKIKMESAPYCYTEHEIQSMINLMYQDVLKEKESLKTK